MVGLPRSPRVFGLLTLSLLGGACAAGSGAPPTGAAATGEPATGSGGAASSNAADASSAASTASGDPSASASSTGGAGSGGSALGSGGAGGDGGSPASGGAGPGTGGAGAGTGATTSGSGGAGGAGGAGPTSGVVTFFAVKPSGAFAAVRDENGDYATDSLSGTYVATRPALTMNSATTAVGLARSSTGALLFTTLGSAGWLAPAAVGPAITTDDTPAIAADLDGSAHGTFHGTDSKHYYAVFDGAGFDPDADPVGGSGASQAFGPSAASIAVVGGVALIAQAGDDQDVYVIAKAGAGWSAPVHVAVTTTGVTLTPAVTAIDPASGGDALVVFAGTDTKLYWSIRDGGAWSVPAEIADALTGDPPSLVATPDGAVVAFRGTNGGIYASQFDGSGWAAPDLLLPITTTTPSSPALAVGAGDADAELAFVRQSDGAVVHLRLLNGSFGAPITVGGSGLTGVAIAAAP